MNTENWGLFSEGLCDFEAAREKPPGLCYQLRPMSLEMIPTPQQEGRGCFALKVEVAVD